MSALCLTSLKRQHSAGTARRLNALHTGPRALHAKWQYSTEADVLSDIFCGRDEHAPSDVATAGSSSTRRSMAGEGAPVFTTHLVHAFPSGQMHGPPPGSWFAEHICGPGLNKRDKDAEMRSNLAAMGPVPLELRSAET